jgi:hypothetical protein
MRIVRILEVEQDLFDVTFEDDYGTVSVITFHGRDAFDNYLLEGLTNHGSGEHTQQYGSGRVADTRRNSMLRH